jgi:ketosteroid isomerase-like protein
MLAHICKLFDGHASAHVQHADNCLSLPKGSGSESIASRLVILCNCRVTEPDLQQADAAWVAALRARDADAARNVLHPEYALVLVHPQPARVEREEWLRTLADYVITEWTVRGSAWDAYGDMATHLQLVDQTAVVLGADRSGPFALTDIWLRGADGVWRVWRRHSTPLRAGAMPRS